MKKNIVRIVAALLVAMLALTLLPVGAFAATSVDVYDEFYGKTDPTWKDYDSNSDYYLNETVDKPSVTIKTSDYDKHVIFGDDLYDLKGVFDWNKSGKDSEEIKMHSSLTFNDNGDHNVSLAYVPHQHKLSRWYSDGTTHWRECLVCKKFCAQGFHEKFMYQNWCQDGDEDGICNICGGDVPYHDITIEAPDGYKVTLNRDNASHRMKITADVDAPAGEQYKLHFIKVRNDGSEQEITRYKENGVFYTKMPTYPMKVVIESK